MDIKIQPLPEIKERITFQELRQNFQNIGLKVTKRAFSSSNFVSGVTGWQLTAEGIINVVGGVIGGFTLSATALYAGTGSTRIQLDTANGIHLGATAFADALFRVSLAGALVASSATITGALTTATGSSLGVSYLSGMIAQANLNLANQGWTQTCVFSATDLDTVAWAAGTLVTAEGTTYNIGAGNTGNMAARTFIYLDIAVSIIAYQVTTTASTAVGVGKVLVATAINGAVEPTWEVFGGIGGLNIPGTSIVAASITTSEIAANTIVAGNMNVATLSAISANMGAITAGTITLDSSGYIRGGQTAYNTGIGFFLGYSTDAYKFSMGNPAGNYLIWDGSTLSIKGSITGSTITGSTIKSIESFTAGENLTAGNVVCIKNSSDDTYYSTANAQVYSGSADTNYYGAITMEVGIMDAKSYYSFAKFDESAFPDAQHILKAELHIHVIHSSGDSQELKINRVKAAWVENTITWNNQPATSDDPAEPGGYYTKSGVLAYDDYYTDITNLVRNWKTATYANYGLRISNVDAVNDHCDIATKENETVAYRISLRITSSATSDGKVYKADSDDYLLCRNIIGIATETVSAAASCKVQTFGKNTDITCSPGDIYYVGTTAGLITNSIQSQARLIRVGKGTTTNELLIDMNDSNVFLESYSAIISNAATYHYLPFPPDAKYALVTYSCNSTISPWGGNVRIDAVGYTSVTVAAGDDPNEFNFSLSSSYLNNGLRLAIYSGTANNVFTYTVYFYK